MSGHSKFANIKHKKERTDVQRGKIFTKLGRELAVAVKMGGSDPSTNTKLKDVVAKAKASNMPNDTIARSIKKAAGELDSVNYETIVYEGYGINGIAVIVECLTDNKNRTAANVRHAFSKNGGNMGTTGCVSFLFDRKGEIVLERNEDLDEDAVMMAAIEAGAEDVYSEEEGLEVVTAVEDFSAVVEAVEALGITPISAEITMIPQTTTDLEDPDDRKKMRKILDQLEDDDDVQNVFTNWGNEE
ncbi:YebC/PmpR family DNA-binding transcriptional regulator [Anaerotalea alkaliphila]|uniref:Probable transcriptional regulatory protein GXN74_07450 n=1 Tax=Anaerotalea alkaliphila TaxID=2662126 RepID=A0A7X5KM97_9FIRM|nr:YebC/PmpR family DNA-binding transcriptional regulator [Anaerotalea alkaliphila]NDL67579.1 YebC/PmpR family DNA-binding transcriptional regulator [Anaerotalea alkaliphila]